MDSAPFDPSPIDSIVGAWKFTKPPHHRDRRPSLPGHLLHYIVSGSYTLQANHREYRVGPGDIIYFYESEETIWKGGPESVTHYSIAYLAGRIPPLPVENRVFRATGNQRKLFCRIHETGLKPPGYPRNFKIYSLLLELLSGIYENARPETGASGTGAWWEIERTIREKRLFRAGMDDLIRISGRSYTSLHRLSKSLFGRPPLERIREIRMEEARGLLIWTSQSITEIAAGLGYDNVSDFSRAFAARGGIPPNKFRKTARTKKNYNVSSP